MTKLSQAQMQEIDGEGFWEGFVCGSLTGIAIGMTLSPDPISKTAIASAWVAAIGACGVALTT